MDTTETGASSGADSEGEPTTGGSGTGSTGDPEPAITRVVYYTDVDLYSERGAAVMLMVEIVDGVAAPPVTLLDAPGEQVNIADAWQTGKWSVLYSNPEDPAQLWLVDLHAVATYEVPLPPTVERVDQVRFSRDLSHLLVRVGPTDSVAFEDMTYYVCALGDQGECALELVEPATGPTTYVSWIAEVSGESGRIWYETVAFDNSASYILQGDVAAPESAAVLESFAGEPGWIDRIALDESALYFTDPSGTYLGAIDISVDPPGPPVEVHPPLAGDVRRTWAEDGTAVLVWNGEAQFGDLHRIALDGAVAGPMQMVNSGSPGHVARNVLEWTQGGSSFVFRSDHETPTRSQIYLADAAAVEGPPTLLSPPLEFGAAIGTIDPAGPDHILYSVSLPTGSQYYRLRLDTPGEAHPISPGGGYLALWPNASADGKRVVYRASLNDSPGDLFLVDLPTDAPAAPVNVTESLPADLGVGSLPRLGPSAAEVIFEVHEDLRSRLMMAPLSPVGAPLQISAEGESVHHFAIVKP